MDNSRTQAVFHRICRCDVMGIASLLPIAFLNQRFSLSDCLVLLVMENDMQALNNLQNRELEKLLRDPPTQVILNSSYALLKELQSKTEKKLVTSAAIAYGFFFLYKRVPMPISTSKTSRSVGEVIT
ncbi:hypothetical protein Tco_0881641 [Tanacetum coccineum]